MFINSNYFERDLQRFREDKEPQLKRILEENQEFYKIADKIKAVFDKFDGKTPNKRIDTALKEINSRIYFCESDKQIFPNKWKLEFVPTYSHTISVFYLFEINTVDAQQIKNLIDEKVERCKKQDLQIKDDLKNLPKKLKKLYKIADDYNSLIDSFSSYTKDMLDIQVKFIR